MIFKWWHSKYGTGFTALGVIFFRVKSLNAHYKFGFSWMACLFSVPQPLSTVMYQMLNFPIQWYCILYPVKFGRQKLHVVMMMLKNVPGPRPVDINYLVSLHSCISTVVPLWLEVGGVRGAWQAAVCGVTKSRTRLSDFTFTFMHWRRKWQPTPVYLPGESQGWQSLMGCRLWGRTELDTT